MSEIDTQDGDNNEIYKKTDSKTIKNIIENYRQNEKALVDQLYFTTSHGTTIGGFREDIWRGMFEQIVPKKFVIEQSVFIIDSKGRVSNEVDLVIFDETYTPYIFRYGRLKFIPIEAVAVVIECKSTSLDTDKLKNWAESIAALETSRESYTRIAGMIATGEPKKDTRSSSQTSTRPIRILCCLNEKLANKTLDSGDRLFDFIIRAPGKDKGLKIETDDTKKDLRAWYLALNHVGYADEIKGCKTDDDFKKLGETETIDAGSDIKDINLDSYQIGQKDEEGEQVSLLTLNLQLNQLLMLINNPILFPHISYAKMFDYFVKAQNKKQSNKETN